MAIQTRRGDKVNYDEDKTLPGELVTVLDTQEAFLCFGAGNTKKLATYEDFSDMLEDSVTATENAKQATVNANKAIDDFRELEVSKLAINDGVRSTVSGWSSSKTGTELDTTNAKVNTLNTSLANQIGTASGASINLPNSFNGGLLLKELQGKSTQNGTPTPDAKVDIVSVGDNGSVVLKVTGKNSADINAMTKTNNLNSSSISGNTITLSALSGKIDANVYESLFLKAGTYTMSTKSVEVTGTGTTLATGIFRVQYYNDLSQYIGIDLEKNTRTKTFTLDKDRQVVLVLYVSSASSAITTDVTVKFTDVMLELGSTSSTYEPYKEQLITIPLTQPLRSVGSVYDRIIKKDGVWGVERNVIYYTPTTNETWGKAGTNVDRYYFQPNNFDNSKRVVSSNYFNYIDGTGETIGTITTSSVSNNFNIGFAFSTKGVSALDDWKSWINTKKEASNPFYILYPAKTPTFEPFSQSIQDILNSLHTNQGVTNVFTTDPQQPTVVVSYGKTDASALSLYAENVSDSKIDKTSVANNLITNVSGTVLGGEQGKILNDKIGNLSDLKTTSKTDLVGAVNEVNNNLTVKSVEIITGVSCKYNAYQVQLYLDGAVSDSSGLICTLPVTCRPLRNVKIPVTVYHDITNNVYNVSAFVLVQIDGKCVLYTAGISKIQAEFINGTHVFML